MLKRIAYHYERPGRGVTRFEESLFLDRPDVKATILETYAGRTVRAGDAVILEPGAAIVWFVFPGAWHDVGRFHLADDTFTGWYTNLCTPVEIGEARWACTDLFLDLWIPANGAPAVWLDEDEFADARAAGQIDDRHARRALAERAAIASHVARGEWPPPVTREFTLEDARAALRRGAGF